jgi:hypothetical protein
MNIAQLIDPAIRSWNLGPGFCTRDNLFGVSYVLLLVVNCMVAVLALYAVFAILGKIVCWRGFAGKDTRTRDKALDWRSADRLERGEGGWVGKVCFGVFEY